VITGSVVCVNKGASSLVNFKVNGIILKRWTNSAGSTNFICDNARQLATNVTCPFDVELDGGESLTFDQNGGFTNAETKIFAYAEELPV